MLSQTTNYTQNTELITLRDSSQSPLKIPILTLNLTKKTTQSSNVVSPS